MALQTRNTIIKKNETDVAATELKQNPFDKTERSLNAAVATDTYKKTGDVKPLMDVLTINKEKTLGGSVDNYNADKQISNVKETEQNRLVDVAKNNYLNNKNDETFKAYTDSLNKGFDTYNKDTQGGLLIQQALRGANSSNIDIKVADAKSDFQMDPVKYADEYKKILAEKATYYGEGSAEAVYAKNELRGIDEEILLSGVRSATLDYMDDPANGFQRLQAEKQKLVDFYGSSESGYMAAKAVLAGDTTESARLDTEASAKFKSGEIGYDGYHAFLGAQMSKYEEGSTSYLKYYSAIKGVEFNKNMDDLMRQQYNTPPGQVIKNMKASQAQYAVGSQAYNAMQNNIDVLDQNLRYEAYQKNVQAEIKKRTESINSAKSKLAILESDYQKGDVGDKTFKSKYSSLSNKVDYLSDSNTLPKYEQWNTYGVS